MTAHTGRMEAVRRFYGVPAYRHRIVRFRGEPHKVLSSTGSHLYLRNQAGTRVGPCHPTWEMDYGDGRDYGDEMDARIGQWRNTKTPPARI